MCARCCAVVRNSQNAGSTVSSEVCPKPMWFCKDSPMASSAAVIVSKAIPAAPISDTGKCGDFLISLQALAMIRTTTEIEIVASKKTAGAPGNLPGKDKGVERP